MPDYVRGKFYNGFPDDWDNVYQIWRTYINQGCPITFHWPTPITDSDNDLKSEMTDLTYTHVKNDEAIPKTKSYRLAENIRSRYSNNESQHKKEEYNCSKYFQNQNTLLTKSSIFESENAAPVVQTRNVSLGYNKDNKKYFRSNVNTSYSSGKTTKLRDYIQEDKLNIIINNLIDKNCSQTYINKIVEMFDCLNYVASYETPLECSYDSRISARQHASKEQIPLQQIVDNNCMETNKIESQTTKVKNYVHSSDLGYKSVKNDFITHQSNPTSIESKHNDNLDNDNLDKSESEVYTGIPKISIKRVLKHREEMHKRQVKKKIIFQRYAANAQHKVRAVESETIIPMVNTKEILFSERRSKPVITNSTPINLNLKVNNTDLKFTQSHDSGAIVKKDEQRTNNRSTVEAPMKEPVLSTKSTIITNDSHSKMTRSKIDNKKEIHPNNKMLVNLVAEQSNSSKNHPKVLIAWMPKVVHYAKSKYKLGLIFKGNLLK